jgi:hypothetical protein
MRSEKERFSRLGFFDTTFGIRVLAENEGRPAEFVLAFEVFDCVDVRAGRDGASNDFVVEGASPPGARCWTTSTPSARPTRRTA